MSDREKAIKEFEHLLNAAKGNYQDFVDLTVDGGEEILAFLKEQEPKQVDLYGNDEWWGLVCVCPDCNAEWMTDKANTHYCPNCGIRVKWE